MQSYCIIHIIIVFLTIILAITMNAMIMFQKKRSASAMSLTFTSFATAQWRPRVLQVFLTVIIIISFFITTLLIFIIMVFMSISIIISRPQCDFLGRDGQLEFLLYAKVSGRMK